MAQRKFKRAIMQLVKDQLVDEKVEDVMASVAQRSDIAAIRWQHKNSAGITTRLETAYGKLEVWCCGYGWTVTREREPLVHARSPRDALFTRFATAKAAGLVHLPDGFGNNAPYNDGLWWNIDRPAAITPVLQAPGEFPVDPSISDEHEWGRQRLDGLLKESSATAIATDASLVSDLEGVAGSWQLPPPKWTERAHGYCELNTPYGLLVVRRSIGWTVERNGAPLVWFLEGEKVIFDKLEHAKTSALAHARDYGDLRFVDGTRWGDPPGNQHARKRGTPDQSRADTLCHG